MCTRRPDTSALKPKAGAAPKKGMQLGKARKANDFLESLRAEGEVIQVSTRHGTPALHPRDPCWAPCFQMQLDGECTWFTSDEDRRALYVLGPIDSFVSFWS